MIHIATVHWHNIEWIALQQEMLRKYIVVPYTLYGHLEGIDEQHHVGFDAILTTENMTHAQKLNLLAERIIEVGQNDDWMLFIDGDAFPIDDVVGKLKHVLCDVKLAAIQRLENLGEKHAHPSFCLTTVGFWKEIRGSWDKGYHWINALNCEETDVGGELLRSLTERNIQWLPLRRSNTLNILPVWYGIYGDLVYHHGAGFRDRGCRKVWYDRGLYSVYKQLDARILNNVVPQQHLKKVRDSVWHPEGRLKRRIGKELEEIDTKMKEKLQTDPEAFITALREGLPGFLPESI